MKMELVFFKILGWEQKIKYSAERRISGKMADWRKIGGMAAKRRIADRRNGGIRRKSAAIYKLFN